MDSDGVKMGQFPVCFLYTDLILCLLSRCFFFGKTFALVDCKENSNVFLQPIADYYFLGGSYKIITIRKIYLKETNNNYFYIFSMSFESLSRT